MNQAIKHLPNSSRPRERLLRAGPAALSDTELVSLVFGGDLLSAGEVVTRIGAAPAIRRAVLGELQGIPGVGIVRACQLLAAMELGCRSSEPSEARPAPVRTPPQAFEHLRDLARLDVEEMHALALDGRHRRILRFCVARGASNVVHVSPRDLFRRLLREGATAAIIAHNHPTGDPLPSADDLDLTRRVAAAGELVGVPVMDHLVVGSEGYYSCTAGRLFREPRA